MSPETAAMLEIAHFIASQPTPEQIIAFHVSPTAQERAYALIAAEKAGTITEEERRELDSYEAMQHIMLHAKAEAYRKLAAIQ